VTRHHTRASRHGSVPSRRKPRSTNDIQRRLPHFKILELITRNSRPSYTHNRSSSRGQRSPDQARELTTRNDYDTTSLELTRPSALASPAPSPASRAPARVPTTTSHSLVGSVNTGGTISMKIWRALRYRGGGIGQIFRKYSAEGITIGGCGGCNTS
jgi:hypothetical protein